MFTDSDWDNSAPLPLAPPSLVRRAALVALGAAVGLAIGAAGASWWWVMRGHAPDRGVAPNAVGSLGVQPAVPAVPIAAEVIASAPPSSGRHVASAAPPTAVAPALQASAAASPADPAADARRRELAWSQSYVRPRECVEDRRGERLVECANHYIRARREFEASHPQR